MHTLRAPVSSPTQGIKWIRTKESSPDRNLEVVRLGQPDMLRKLERALENGSVPISALFGRTRSRIS